MAGVSEQWWDLKEKLSLTSVFNDFALANNDGI